MKKISDRFFLLVGLAVVIATYIGIAVIIAGLFSCSPTKSPCYSTKYVPVTFIVKNGSTYTISVPYCDTIKLFTDKKPDSAKAIIKGF